jgi:6-phosphogluconolactonase (cycloisomerase 2 family)
MIACRTWRRIGRARAATALLTVGLLGAVSSCGSSPTGSTGADSGSADGSGGDLGPDGGGAPATIGGMVSGLVGSGLVLGEAAQTLAVTHNGRFNFPTVVAGGATYTVTVTTQPTAPAQTCVVRNGTGSVAGGGVANVIVSCAPHRPRYALVLGDFGLASYAVDGATGRLSLVGSDPGTGVGPHGVAVAPSGKFAYVANAASGFISQYLVGIDGTLTALSPPTVVVAGAGTMTIAIDPTGRFGYALTSLVDAYDVLEYAIGADGQLSPIGSIASSAGPTTGIAIDPAGQAVYVANSTGALSQYTIGSTGTLSAMATATVASGAQATAVVVDPTGRYVYAINAMDGAVSGYAVGPGGALTPLSPALVAVDRPTALACDPTGKTLLVTTGNSTVIPLAIGDGGKLTALTPAATESAPAAVAIDGDGQFVFVANNNGDSLSQLKLLTTGGLVPNTPPSAPARKPTAIAMVSGDELAQPVGKFAYAVNGDNTLSLYTVGAAGALGAAGSISVVGTGPQFVAVEPSGKYAYVANSSNNTVSQYAIGATGGLTALTPATVMGGQFPIAVQIHPSGRFAYLLNQTDRTVSQFAVGPGGALSLLTPGTFTVSTTDFPGALIVDPSGRYAYVTLGTGKVVALTISGGGLSLTPGGTVATGMEPAGLAVSPSGQRLYVANGAGNSISQYRIGATGLLTPLSPATVPAGSSPFALVIDPTEKFAYAINAVSSDVSQYSVGNDGALTALTPARVAAGVAGTDVPNAIVIDPSGRTVYVANDASPGGVWQYTVGTDGKLQPATPPSAPAGALTRHLALAVKWR